MTVTPNELNDIQAKSILLHSHAEIENALSKMAKEITASLADKNPIIMCMGLGGIVSFGNLVPQLKFPLEIDYVHVARYGNQFTGSENLEWRARPNSDMKGRVVVIFDDILDEGLTLAATIAYCREKGAKEIFTAVLLEKDKQRKPGGLEKSDFVGIHIEDKFVFGYGLDYKNYLRNLDKILYCP